MEIITLPSGPLETNVYLVDNGKGEALLFDAAPDSYSQVTALLKERQLTLKGLFLTHGHFDHILDTARFKDAGIPVTVHHDSTGMVEDPAQWTPFTMPGVEFPVMKLDSRDRILTEESLAAGQDKIEEAGLNVFFLPAPGHCPGSIVYYLPQLNAAFVGDVIFYRSIGRTDLPGGSHETLIQSIKDKVLSLPVGTLLYPGHGPATLVEEEREHNPYL
jgi:hydroxyacylglutathione hydrolase